MNENEVDMRMRWRLIARSSLDISVLGWKKKERLKRKINMEKVGFEHFEEKKETDQRKKRQDEVEKKDDKSLTQMEVSSTREEPLDKKTCE